MRRILARLAVAFAGSLWSLGMAASSTVPDYSDLWWNPAESGWGAHVTLQDDVAFMVLYVYDAQRVPRFFVASDMRLATAAASGAHEFRGTLYRTRGTPFAAPFDASHRAVSEVGTAQLRFTSAAAGSLVYVVDGVTVTKAITRQTWSPVKLAGTYRGGGFGVTDAGCTAGAGLPTFGFPGSVEIAQSGDGITIETMFEPGFAEQGRCRYAGRLQQHGATVSVTAGTYRCEYVNGPSPVEGAFELSEVEVADSGFNGLFRATEPACVYTGRFGGIRLGYAPATPLPEKP